MCSDATASALNGQSKRVHVLVVGRPDAKVLRRWRRGVFLEEGKTAPAQVSFVRAEKSATWLRLALREGRKRQIRRVAAALGHPVRKLVRVRIGPVELENLEPGEWRPLTRGELRSLQTARFHRPRPRRRGRK